MDGWDKIKEGVLVRYFREGGRQAGRQAGMRT